MAVTVTSDMKMDNTTTKPSHQGSSSSSSSSSSNNSNNNNDDVAVNPKGTPSRVRRKASVEESIDNAVSVQRLVEYFLVISSHPRWESVSSPSHNNTAKTTPGGGSPPPLPLPGTPEFTRPNVKLATTPPATPRRDDVPLVIANSSPISSAFPSSAAHLSSSSSSLTATPPRLRLPNWRRPGGSWKRGNENNVNSNNKHADETSEPSLASSSHERSLKEPQLPGERSERARPCHPGQQQQQQRDERPDATKRQEGGTTENIHMPEASAEDSHMFAPKVTARFPLHDHVDNPLNPMTTQFCFPGGELILPSKEYQMPTVHHFVLTNDKGRKVYGTCLTVYEEFRPGENTPWQNGESLHLTTVGRSGEVEISPNQAGSVLYVPKCICILSIWPYVTAFREYLAQLYRLATSTDCMEAPIERYVMNLCMEIPAPPPGAFEVRLSILDSVIRFWSPPAKLPTAYVALPYQTLFDCLDIDNILHLWYCLTLEPQVILVSSQRSILMVCSEILCSLLYPMKWSHLYVPLLPKFLSPILDAPVPFIVGIPRDNWMEAQRYLSPEAIVVDLDRNNVLLGQQTMEFPAVPGKKWTKLQTCLQGIAGHLFWQARGLDSEYYHFAHNKWTHPNFHQIAKQKGETIWREKLHTFDHAFNLQYTPDSEHLLVDEAIERERSQWDQVQEAFLWFFVALLKNYRTFVHVPDSSKLGSPPSGSADWVQWSSNHTFDKDGFIASQKSEYAPYLKVLCGTQQFDDFITKRLYSPELPDIVFFDQSIDAKLNRSRLKIKKVDTPFLQSAKTHKQLETFVAVEPNANDLLLAAPFLYNTWPETFDTQLFCRPRPIPNMITAEFDRQASLVKQLRRNHTGGGSTHTGDVFDIYGYDYNSSPEGMAFTVFFFAYSAVIGQEWQEYQARRKQMGMQASPQKDVDTDNNAVELKVEKAFEEAVEVTTGNSCVGPSMLSDITLGLCEGDASAAVENAIIYMTNNNPCPNLDGQAQAASDALNNLAMTFDPRQMPQDTSLLDNDEAFAEYEEAREVTVAQLDLAFDSLKMMDARGLLADSDVYKSLMEACGRCGDTKRAFTVIESMKREGLVADNNILGSFMASFAHYDAALTEGHQTEGRRVSDAYSHFLKKKFHTMKGETSQNMLEPEILSGEESNASSELVSESGSERSVTSATRVQDSANSSFMQIFSSHLSLPSSGTNAAMKKKGRRQKSRKLSILGSRSKKYPVSDRMQKQLVLGDSLLTFLYPEICIDTFGDACPHCSNVMKEEDIVSGWKPGEFQDFTTSCPQCQHRFVPRFKVSTSAWTFEGSQGPGTPLYCEFLSPWVLRKELGHILLGEKNRNGINVVLDPEWRSGRDIRATIWWNLIAMFRRHGLPFTFLLQGSFQNRLINPVPQED